MRGGKAGGRISISLKITIIALYFRPAAAVYSYVCWVAGDRSQNQARMREFGTFSDFDCEFDFDSQS